MILQSLIVNISTESNKNNISINNNKDNQKLKESELMNLFCNDINKINEKDECNWTPLYRSIISGNIKATEVLLNNGADPNIQCSMGETPLYQAVDMEKKNHVKLLLQFGADPNICQIDGLSSLHLAVLKQNIIIIKYLLKFKANPNKQSSLYKQTPVHLAIKNNVDSNILLILANSGGLLTLKDKFGKKPIDYINSEEMRKTVEMLKLEKNNSNSPIKNIYFTPSKNNKFKISKVFSKTIKSVSPKINGLRNQGNIKNLKDSGKSKISIIEIKSGESNKKKENESQNTAEKTNGPNDKLKINLFKVKKQNQENSKFAYKKSKYLFKNEKIGNKLINNSKNKNYKIYIESPIQEESSSVISSNKYFKNSQFDGSSNNKNLNKIINSSFSKSNIKSDIKRTNNFAKTDLANKYIRKKTADKISAFKCESTKKIKNNSIINNIEEIKTKKIIIKSSSNKNIHNSRNSIFNSEFNNRNGNYLTTDSLTNSMRETFTIYKTQLLKDKNSLSINIKKKNEDKENIDNNEYNKPKVIINPYNDQKSKKLFLKYPIKYKNKRNKNKNFFNSTNNPLTLRTHETNKLISLINKEQQPFNFVNNENKENISTNIKKCVYSSSSRNTNKDKFNKNSYNSSQSLRTFYTYTKNENNSLLEIVEKRTKNKKFNEANLPIYKWLKEIDLLVYLSLFIKKKIYSFEKIISDLKSKKIVITPDNIRKIGIVIPGHIYRIFIKLEMDAELIDKNIYEFLLSIKREEENIKNGKGENEESAQSLYDCCGIGCCSLKRSHIKIKVDNHNLSENKIFLDFDRWLRNINMIKYKENFIKSGFDKTEFFILQMFSSLPLEEKIFENEINIDNNNDIDLFIIQLNKDVKFISNKLKKKRSSSVKVDKNSISKYLLLKQNEIGPKKKLTRTSSNICSIF